MLGHCREHGGWWVVAGGWGPGDRQLPGESQDEAIPSPHFLGRIG